MIRRDALREYSRGSLWLLPVVAVMVSVALGAVLSRIDVGPTSLLAFQGTADDARNLLIGISSTMVTVIALLLGLAVVALQLSSTQFSPRLLRNFLRDRPNQIVLAVFVGTFGYSAAGLFEVGVSGGERVAEFPRFAVTVAIGLLFLSLGLLVFFADHLAHSIQVDQVLRVVERSTLEVITTLPTGGEPTPLPPPDAHVVAASASGYVQVAYVRDLVKAAAAQRVHLRLRPRVGEHVVAGSPLAWAWCTGGSSGSRVCAPPATSSLPSAINAWPLQKTSLVGTRTGPTGVEMTSCTGSTEPEVQSNSREFWTCPDLFSAGSFWSPPNSRIWLVCSKAA